MAMSTGQRGGRANIPNQLRPPRLTTGRLYEQFKPMSEWRQDDDYDTLLVYLPGFQKDYIKVTIEDLNIVRVRGERQIEGNRWSRFQEDYRVPENCEMRGIRARFDGGILTITMPARKIINNPPPTQLAAPKTKEEEPFTGTNKQEEALPPNSTTKEEEEAIKEKKPDDKPETSYSSLPPQEAALKPSTADDDDVVQFTIGSLIPKYSAPAKKDKQQQDDHVVGEKSSRDLDKGKIAAGKLEKALDHQETKKRDQLDEGQVISGAAGENYKKVAMNMNKEAIDDIDRIRKVGLVNVGVGILVIVALGLQVSYTIGLIGGGKGN